MGQELDTEFQTGDCLEVEFEAADLTELMLHVFDLIREDDEAPDDDGGTLPRILISSCLKMRMSLAANPGDDMGDEEVTAAGMLRTWHRPNSISGWCHPGERDLLR